MMKTYKNLIGMLRRTLYDDEIRQFLLDNHLFLPLYKSEEKESLLWDDSAGIISARNKISERLITAELLGINSRLAENGIRPVFIKGIVLARQLYDREGVRRTGDIDLFVNNSDGDGFERAYSVLKDIGYSVSDKRRENNPHHIRLDGNGFVVELHKKFLHPSQISDNVQDYFSSHLTEIPINGVKITALDRTATLLHLICHLYMHINLNICNNFGYENVFRSGEDAFIRLKILRMFEIALYAEKYHNEINWDDIAGLITGNEYTGVMKEVISDVQYIFPDTFPEDLFRTVFNGKYKMSKSEKVIPEFYDYKYSLGEYSASMLCKLIAEKEYEGSEVKESHKDELFVSISVCDGIIEIDMTAPTDIVTDDNGKHDFLESTCVSVLIISCGKSYREFNFSMFFHSPNDRPNGMTVSVYDYIGGRYADEAKAGLENGILRLKIPTGYIRFCDRLIIKNCLCRESGGNRLDFSPRGGTALRLAR